MFPNSDQFAMAIVTACRLTEEDPIALAKGELGLRARHIALNAMIEAFPKANAARLAKCLAYGSPGSAKGNLTHQYHKTAWWREDWVDEVVGVLVADQYGEQAQ